MSISRHKWTREQASAAARARWAAAHAGLPPRPESAPLAGRLLRRVIVDDLGTGKQHVMNFYGTRRLNQYDVLVDGEYWRTCGWSAALAKVRKSCVRIGREK
jgi:hypothetical protein